MAKKIYQIPCQKIISGGQTGVDRGALDACLEISFNCGGWCPKGRKAENGSIPLKYPLRETSEIDYKWRTLKNIIDSDGTLIIVNDVLSGGTLLTKKITRLKNKPLMIVFPGKEEFRKTLQNIVTWICVNKIVVLNVAGPRESEWKTGYQQAKTIVYGLIHEILQAN